MRFDLLGNWLLGKRLQPKQYAEAVNGVLSDIVQAHEVVDLDAIVAVKDALFKIRPAGAQNWAFHASLLDALMGDVGCWKKALREIPPRDQVQFLEQELGKSIYSTLRQAYWQRPIAQYAELDNAIREHLSLQLLRDASPLEGGRSS